MGQDSGAVVWGWHLWDHLVQDYDSAKANYGDVASHPELLDINFYMGNPLQPDWIHCNSVAYNSGLDQIILSAHDLSEIWIIDHSTTTADAASHSGGLYGKGGDFLWRWGNPAAYRHGSTGDRQLFLQHDAHWISDGFKDAGSILLFINGQGRPDGSYSTVDIISTPVDSLGFYVPTLPFLPDSLDWTYTSPVPEDFYSMMISGAQMLPGANVLICEGDDGRFFEIDSLGNIVWEYVCPVGLSGPFSQGEPAIQNIVFRCTFLPWHYQGFNGKDMTPGALIELNPLVDSCSLSGLFVDVADLNTPPIIVNQSGDYIYFSSDIDYYSIEIFDLAGRLLSCNKSPSVVATNTLMRGMVLLKISANGYIPSIIKLLIH